MSLVFSVTWTRENKASLSSLPGTAKYETLTDTRGSVRAGVVSTIAHKDLLLAAEGAHCVDAGKAGAARLSQAAALVYVCTIKDRVQAQRAEVERSSRSFPTNSKDLTNTVPVSVLGESAQTFLLRCTLERAWCVLTQEVFATTVLPHGTLIHIWTQSRSNHNSHKLNYLFNKRISSPSSKYSKNSWEGRECGSSTNN